MEHEGKLNSQSLENYLHRAHKRLLGIALIIPMTELMELQEHSMVLATLGKFVEMEGLRISEIWRSLCDDCRKITVKEIYRSEDSKKEIKTE